MHIYALLVAMVASLLCGCYGRPEDYSSLMKVMKDLDRYLDTKDTRERKEPEIDCTYNIVSPSHDDDVDDVTQSYITVNGTQYESSDYSDTQSGSGVFVILIEPFHYNMYFGTFNTNADQTQSWELDGFLNGAATNTTILLATADDYTAQLSQDCEYQLMAMGALGTFEYRSSLSLVVVKTGYMSYRRIDAVESAPGKGPSILDYSGPCGGAPQPDPFVYCTYDIVSPSYEDDFFNVWQSFIQYNSKQYLDTDFRDSNIGTGIFVILMEPNFHNLDYGSYNTNTDQTQSWAFSGFINGAVTNTIILLATADEYTAQLSDDAKQLLVAMGASGTFEYRSSLAIVAVKIGDGTFRTINSVENSPGKGPSRIDYSGTCDGLSDN